MKKILLAFSLLIFIGSCNNSDRDNMNTTQNSRDFLQAETVMADVFKIFHSFAAGDSIVNDWKWGSALPLACADSIWRMPDKGPFPITLTIDFGSEGKSCSEGRTRRGRIVATFSGHYFEKGTTIKLRTENYMVDDMKVFCKMTLTMTDTLENNRLQFKRVIDSASILIPDFPNDNLIFYQGNNTLVISNYKESDIRLHSFDLTGEMSGVATTGNLFTAKVTDRLVTGLYCAWYTGGSAEVNPANIDKRIARFPEGCSNKAVVIVNGDENDVYLK